MQAFDQLEPIGGVRDDYRFASIVATMVNLRRNFDKYPKPFPISDFVLLWGDEAAEQAKKHDVAKPVGKTWQQMKMLAQVLAASYNAMEESDKKRRRKRE